MGSTSGEAKGDFSGHRQSPYSPQLKRSMVNSGERQMKKRRGNSSEEENKQSPPTPVATNVIDGLPYDVKFNIISRVPTTSLVPFTFACKSWNNLYADTHLINHHVWRMQQDAAAPCLIFHTDYPLRNQLRFVQLSDEEEMTPQTKARMIKLPFERSMAEFCIVGSSNGLLCLSDSLFPRRLCIYNPFTGRYKELPRLPECEEQIQGIGFGYHPFTKEYKVVRIVQHTHTYMVSLPHGRRIVTRRRDKPEVQILRLNTNKWDSLGEFHYEIVPNTTSVVLNGRWHCLTRLEKHHSRPWDRVILSFDFADEKFKEIPKPKFVPYHIRIYNYHLLNLRNCVAVAFATSLHMEIWAMKEYDVKESWVKEYAIPSYSPPPRLKNHHDLRPYSLWSNARNGMVLTVLWSRENREILIVYKSGVLLLYNPENIIFRDLTFRDLPKLFTTIVHVGGLNWIDTLDGV